MATFKSRLLRRLAEAVPSEVLVVRGSTAPRRRLVALTFDDGPGEMTPRYLDLLAELDARATFFVVGENVARAPDRVLAYVQRGHEVAGHGFTHTPFPLLGPAALIEELTRTADLLPPCVSRRPFVRPPQGRVTPRSLARVALAGYVTVLWSLDSDDCRTRDVSAIVARVANGRVAPGEIILFHEQQAWTLDALPPIVEGLRRAGFALVTVGELLGF